METIKKKEFIKLIKRNNYSKMFKNVFETINPGKKFVPAEYLGALHFYVNEILEVEEKKIVLSMPPRYCKSTEFSIFLPALFLGFYPEAKILHITYGEDLAKDLAIKCKTVMESEWYKESFPNTRIDPQKSAPTNFVTTCGGGKLSTTMHGGITGFGADLITIDDPIKADDINSLEREKVNNIYSNSIYSRLDNKQTGKIVVVAQRLHKDDLIGHIIATDPDFEVVNMPLIAVKDEEWPTMESSFFSAKKFIRKKGELLCPEREGWDIVEKYKRNLGPAVFEAQYQQNPLPSGGVLIKKESLQTFNSMPVLRRIVYSWDTASKTGEKNDYSACVVIGEDANSNYYLFNVFRDRLEFPALVNRVKSIYNLYKFQTNLGEILIENSSSGIQLIQTLKQDQCFSSVTRSIPSLKNKKDRFACVTIAIESKKLLFPEGRPAWYEDFEKELLDFPYSKYDDQCDALSQAIEYLNNNPFKRPVLIAGRSGGFGGSGGFGYDYYGSANVGHLIGRAGVRASYSDVSRFCARPATHTSYFIELKRKQDEKKRNWRGNS